MHRFMIRLEYLVAAALVGACVAVNILVWSHLLGWTFHTLGAVVIVAAVVFLALITLPPSASEIEPPAHHAEQPPPNSSGQPRSMRLGTGRHVS